MTAYDVADLCQSAVGIFAVIGYLPQLTALKRTGSTEGISAISWLIWTFGSALAVFYATSLYLRTGIGLPLVFSTSVNFVLVLTTYLLILRCRSRGRSSVALIPVPET